MIETGGWPLSQEAALALRRAAAIALGRGAEYISRDDLWRVVVTTEGSAAARIWAERGEPAPEVGTLEPGWEDPLSDILDRVKPSHPIITAIELAADGWGITTAGLLDGVVGVKGVPPGPEQVERAREITERNGGGDGVQS